MFNGIGFKKNNAVFFQPFMDARYQASFQKIKVKRSDCKVKLAFWKTENFAERLITNTTKVREVKDADN